MTLSEKIIKERKKLGLSQEELAEKMNVSRQAVSKWEGNQSVPEIEKILQLSSLFGVTTDYLLKDEMEIEAASKSEIGVNECTDFENAPSSPPRTKVEKVRTVTLSEAETFLSLRRLASRKIAAGTFLCIISVIPLFLLAVGSESQRLSLSENAAAAFGLAALFIIVAAATALFVYTGSKNSPYEYIEKEPFETEKGVTDMVTEQMKTFNGSYIKLNILGTVFCILSPISLFIGSFGDNDFISVVSLCITLIIAGVGAVFFILAGVPHEAMQKLLKEGDYSESAKKANSVKGAVSAAYWLLVTAIYLLMLFLPEGQVQNWKSDGSWIIWPVAGVLFPVVLLICDVIRNKKDNK